MKTELINDECREVIDLLFKLRRRANHHNQREHFEAEEKLLRLIETMHSAFAKFLDDPED